MNNGSVLSRCVRLGVIGVVAAAVAQEAAGRAAVAQSQPLGTPSRGPSGPAAGPVVSVNFPGGTLSEFVETVKRAARPGGVNVVFPHEAAHLAVPPMQLENVTAYTALESLRWTYPQSGEIQIAIQQLSPTGEGISPTFALAYLRQQRPPAPTGQTPAQVVATISLRDLIDPPDADTNFGVKPIAPEVILSSVETAMAMALGDDAAPDLRFHKESGLLIIRGTEPQVTMVRRLVEEIRNDLQVRLNVARQRLQSEANRRRIIEQAEQNVRERARHVNATRDKLNRVWSQREAGGATDEEVRRVQDELETAESNFAIANMRLQSVREESHQMAGATSDAQTVAELRRVVAELRRRVEELESRMPASSPQPAPRQQPR